MNEGNRVKLRFRRAAEMSEAISEQIRQFLKIETRYRIFFSPKADKISFQIIKKPQYVTFIVVEKFSLKNPKCLPKYERNL